MDSSEQESQPTPARLVFFISGNPGLIGYYHTFLSLLSDGLYNSDSKAHAPAYFIYAASLGGFEVDPKAKSKRELLAGEDVGPRSGVGHPYTFHDQITLTYRRLQSLVSEISSSSPVAKEAGLEVNLIGHSAGTYIALELLRLIQNDPSPPSVPVDTTFPSIKVKSVFLITPTVIDVTLSPNGRIAAQLKRWIPYFPQLAQGFMRVVSFPLPKRFVRWLVGFSVKGNPGAAEAVANFLTSKGMIRQAL
ncbi:MAG: hypothetical protein Q9160_000411 [Pyrenula sp. 1 TL-2023]